MKPPRYIRMDGHLYVRHDHFAEQLEKAILSAKVETVHKMIDREAIRREAVLLPERIDMRPGAINLVTS